MRCPHITGGDSCTVCKVVADLIAAIETALAHDAGRLSAGDRAYLENKLRRAKAELGGLVDGG